MRVTVNGQVRDVPEETDIGSLLAEMKIESRGVAVALNGEVVPRSEWDATKVIEGSAIEVVRAVQGG